MVSKTAILVSLFAAFAIAVAFGSESYGSILSPLNAYAAAGMIFFAYAKADRSSRTRITLLFYAFACLAWAAADTGWVIMLKIGTDPSTNIMNNAIYMLTNGFLLTALLIFAVLQFSKWNNVLLFVDSLIITGMILMLIWITYLHKDTGALADMLRSDFTGAFSVFSDVGMLIGVILWFISVRVSGAPGFMWIFSFGVAAFSFADMIYYYAYLENLYVPNSIIDLLYTLSLDSIAFGALWKTYRCSGAYNPVLVTNTASGGKSRYLLFFPAIALLMKVSNPTSVELHPGDIVFFLLLILIYSGTRKYVQLSIENERLLSKEQENNRLLELRVAEQVKELSFLANQDTLTTLYNRRFFVNYLEENIRSLRSKETLVLILIDLDRFKLVNDNFGHEVGDKILIELSARMLAWNQYGATFARLGGDEFAVMLAGKYSTKEIENCCADIIKFCSAPIKIDVEVFRITVSMGVALHSSDASDGMTLLKNADIAMYQAKSQGYNKFQFFDPLFSENLNRNREIEFLLKSADLSKDFELFFQPQFALPGMELVGAEALLRWNNAEHGYIPPNLFIPVAEETDYIFVLGKWVIKETIKQAIKWNSMHTPPLKISFNISPKQLNDEEFIGYLKSLITSTGVNPAWIDAEITENVMINDESKVDVLFDLFSSLGITVSLDDFGSGYSSLGYLSRYSFDKIKIDKLLIDKMSPNNISGLNVVNAAVNLAKAVGLKTVAEGVETKEQVELLTEMGCDQVQGYLLGRPVPAEVFEEKFL